MSEETRQSKVLRKALVVCLGNPDRGDDGVGALVAQALVGRLPVDVALVVRRGNMLSVIDDWAGFDAVVCVDAVAATGTRGRIRRIDLERETLPADKTVTSDHAFGLAEAVQLARTLEQAPEDIVIYAVESDSFEAGARVTEEVASAVGEVVGCVIEEVRCLRRSLTEASPHA